MMTFDFAPKTYMEIQKQDKNGPCNQYAAKAPHNLGLNAHATFSGSLLWQYFHPWPSDLLV
jgi:hypothetical protein